MIPCRWNRRVTGAWKQRRAKISELARNQDPAPPPRGDPDGGSGLAKRAGIEGGLLWYK
uniref:Uncharacterized protein n=1 Tax=Arion vulgaris TaxID=1028688 RepID=A0A0B7B6G5_9EUPU